MWVLKQEKGQNRKKKRGLLRNEFESASLSIPNAVRAEDQVRDLFIQLLIITIIIHRYKFHFLYLAIVAGCLEKKAQCYIDLQNTWLLGRV